MTDRASTPPEARRLEGLWSGDFGDEYVDRNTDFSHRRPFWTSVLSARHIARVLEVGCNIGGNLEWIAGDDPDRLVVGVDVNARALRGLRGRVPSTRAVETPARSLPFRDRVFDLVFTMGVLIHQPDDTLSQVMAEMVRCSRRWVLCGEYFAPETTQVAYRGQEGALFKRDYGRLFCEGSPELTMTDTGFLSRGDGWDDVTWWLLERR
jgi:pseudaminic acid biosynthesis-associated methylase